MCGDTLGSIFSLKNEMWGDTLGSVFCVEPNVSHWTMCGDTLGSICFGDLEPNVPHCDTNIMEPNVSHWNTSIHISLNVSPHRYGAQCVSLGHIATHISQYVPTQRGSPMCLTGLHMSCISAKGPCTSAKEAYIFAQLLWI